MSELLHSSAPEPIGPRPVLVLLYAPHGRRPCWLAHDRTTACRSSAKGHDLASATLAAPFTLAVPQRSALVIASMTTPHNGSKEHPMITETQPHVIVLQLTDALLAQLQPFMSGLDITATSHSE